MSSSRRIVSPQEQRPTRRRRVEPPGYQNNINQSFDPAWTDTNDTATATATAPLFMNSSDPTSTSQHRPSLQMDLSQPPQSLAGDLASSSRNTNPVIPLEAILSSENMSLQSFEPIDRFVDLADDSDDDDMILALGPNGMIPYINRVNNRSRAASNAVQDRSRHRVRRRRMVAPQESAPPALLLYQMGASGLASSQQDQLDLLTSSSARYLPLVLDSASTAKGISPSGSSKYIIEPSQKDFIDVQRRRASRMTWVPNMMPVELFEAITKHLSRDDIKAMRLVNREFERGVSRALFDTVVVPFNTELYDMIEQDKSVKRDFKGKNRADEPNSVYLDLVPGSLQWKNARDDKEDKVYKGHGLRVFEGFGSHIRRFGMSFEVKEDALRNPPQKKALHQLDSYYGSYDWPSVEYTRFEKLAGLERTADETSQMKIAFSHLNKVRQLALCMDSGLGWMNGPDKSMRSQILQRAPPVFGGCSHGIVDAQSQERAKLWRVLEQTYRKGDNLQELREGRLQRAELQSSLQTLPGLDGTSYSNTACWATVDGAVIDDALPMAPDVAARRGYEPPPLTGVIFVHPDEAELIELAREENDVHFRPTPAQQPTRATTTAPNLQLNMLQQNNHAAAAQALRNLSSTARGIADQTGAPPQTRLIPAPAKQRFSPAHLDKHQKEWLLEAEWAQRAFLMSYMLAIVDNQAVFSNIATLNLARISSNLVPVFYRQDFWEALPNLGDVSVGVIPDWRTVERDEAGFVETKEVDPSKAIEGAYRLLRDYIGPRPSIKKIAFGWAAGGEQADGCMARNNHILPAPVTLLAHTVQNISTDDAMLHLPHVEHLTLSNCWMSPCTIVNLVKNLEGQSLKKMTFDSVSLTAHPGNTIPNGGNQNAGAAAAAINAMVFNAQPMGLMQLPGQMPTPPAAQQFANQFWQGPGLGQPHGPWAQGMLQQMQQMMIQNNIQHHHLHQMWSTHPAGMTLGQITHTLTMLANGGVGAAGLFVAQGQANAGAANHLPFFGAPLGFMPPPFANPLPQAFPPALPTNQQWYDGHRDGSWVKVMDALSPGPRLEMYHTRDEFDPPVEKRETSLLCVELKSCGYVQLQNPPFDQTMLENPAGRHQASHYFQRRRTQLASNLLTSSDRYLGHIVQYMPEREQEALTFAWDMRTSWDDQEKAQEAEYDGYLPGGTGRVSGLITKDTPVGDSATRIL